MHFNTLGQKVDLTYSDVFLIPSNSNIGSRLNVDLSSTDGTGSSVPLVSSNMNSVTGKVMAVSMARRGGIGVIPQDLSIDSLVEAISWVKNQPINFSAGIILPPSATVAQACEVLPPSEDHCIIIQDTDFRGVVPALALSDARPGASLGTLTRPAWVKFDISELADNELVFNKLNDAGAFFAPVFDSGKAIGVVSRKVALRNTIYKPNLDSQGRLAVSAAVGINGDVAGKAKRLVEAGVDVLVLDTAHGHQSGMLKALETVRNLDLGLPIVAGNVVTANAVADLVSAGANILKVGVGPGAMCTTRMMTAVGRPQFSAVLETAEKAKEYGAHVWADGGVRYPRDVALALAAGAASVMIGSWFAGTIEAPGRIISDSKGDFYKESWGMASTKAVQGRFGSLNAFELARKTLFAEGISGSKIYIDPARPSVEDLVDMITSGVRSSFTYAGAETLAQFHDKALIGIQSAAGYEEGKSLPVSW